MRSKRNKINSREDMPKRTSYDSCINLNDFDVLHGKGEEIPIELRVNLTCKDVGEDNSQLYKFATDDSNLLQDVKDSGSGSLIDDPKQLTLWDEDLHNTLKLDHSLDAPFEQGKIDNDPARNQTEDLYQYADRSIRSDTYTKSNSPFD